jgi:Nif-specific regulatory protein
VPIRIGKKVVGVLAAQPAPSVAKRLSEYQRFLEMVANLIGQSVRLSQEVAQEKMEIVEERDVLRRTVRGQYGFDNIIGHTQSMRRIFEQVRLVAKWNTTVLIRGETGTGKELIANAIHYNSPRARGSYVKLNCAALPETLLESELFGHEKGAFTGAVAQRKGRFEQAEGGTVFLDEIGEISAPFQAKLLRVLQEGELERVGGTKTIKVDVRVVPPRPRSRVNPAESARFLVEKSAPAKAANSLTIACVMHRLAGNVRRRRRAARLR